MNPNLPVGGSAFDLAGTRSIADPSGRTSLRLGTSYSSFDRTQRGTEAIDPSFTDSIDVWLVQLDVQHYLARWATVGASLPVTWVRIQPVDDLKQVASGLGDLELSSSFEVGALWSYKPTLPSVRVRPSLTLPTGETERLGMLGGDVPPHVIAIGRGAFGAGLGVQATQRITSGWQGKAWVDARRPLGFGESGLLFGSRVAGGGGVRAHPLRRWIFDGEISLEMRGRSRARGVGAIINSGGSWLYGQV